ncbi:hypothetical protein CCUS01_04850 [Colletotrichum cuscutae]|uniref:Zn(2)-C6 fungal-type domain-containing protein n=1 Tax=Colletotrichum cuscutae TaxID=1209917 RepID=A0AAI9V9D3_9PEZI|nr:hypothetical protein CCUS01_04850 [Colletotrichum cuscutae]
MTEAVVPPGPASAAKKKFATPPVKIACLACRASRTRCDGASPCASCKSRGRDCVFKPSRRGGARVRRKPRPAEELAQQVQAFNGEMPPDEVTHQDRESLRLGSSSEQLLTDATAISVQNYIDPGAGLKQLQDFFQDSDFIFDTLFMSGVPGSTSGESASEHSFTFPTPQIPVARTYKSDQAILDAYYIFIHPFFPILPAPSGLPMDQAVSHFQNDTEGFADEYQPSTPISLAISAILALIPYHNDTNHLNKESVIFRRRYAQYLAQCAIESIEIESEIPDSSIEPPKALNESPDDFPRQQFHPGVPIELESVIALDILSVYEYAQRGNLKKMQARAGQALVAAMSLSIHTCAEEDAFSEARRRVWWMTYICVCQGSIVSNSEPTFSVFTPSYTAKYPVIQSDPEAFAVYIQAQQAILSATQFVIELNKTVKSGGDMARIYARMKEMEAYLEPLNTMADSWILQSTTTTPLDPTEEVLSRSLRCMARIKLNSARIKLHRYCAFFDMPVFSGKYCDLKSKADNDANMEPRSWPSCSCSSMMSLPSAPVAISNGSATPPGKKSPHSEHSPSSQSPATFPFSSHQSAKICLKAAINISQSFDDLPYPNPFGQLCPAPCYLAPTSTIVCPRTMPSFACCAMQCAYALLMVNHKTKAMYPENALATPMVESLLMRLQTGLASISATLENYATAFEALGGMRVHGGQEPDPVNGSRAVPLYQTAAYNFTDAADGASKFAWSKDGYVYTRMGNPTNSVFETRMAMLEGGVGAVAAASGHAAQFMALTNCCEPGQNFVSTSWLYGGTYNQFRVYMKKFKIDVKWVVGNEPADIDAAIDENTRCVYVETISNPKHSVPDIKAIADVAHKHGIPLIVDNTFGMGGYLCQPIKQGADIVTHSATKWIGGHGTSMGGIVIDGGHFDWSAADGYHGLKFWERYGFKALSAKLRMDSMRDLGPCLSPFNAWLLLQGLETLALRGERHAENTQKLAEWLEAHPSVNWVLYPGLKSHPDYEYTKRVFTNGAGGVLTFGVAGNIEQVRSVVDNLKLCSHLANVGDAKTLIIHPWVTTHQQLPDEEKIKGGVTPDLIRVSVGIEGFEDIKKDFEQAFDKAGLPAATKAGGDPFSKALNLVSGGFMGKASTGAPRPGTDGTISVEA